MDEMTTTDNAALALYPKADQLSYIQFFNKMIGQRSGMDAEEIAEELGGGIQLGCPLLRVGEDEVHNASGLGFVLLDHVHYWYVGAKQDPEAVSEEDMSGKKGWNEAYQALLLVLPGDEALPVELKPAVLTVSSFNKWTQVQAIEKHLRAVARAATPAFAQQHGELVTRVKPEYRVVSRFRVTTQPIKSGPDKGTRYAVIKSKAKPINLQQIEALQAYENNPQCQAREENLRELFAKRTNELLAIGGPDDDLPF